MKKTINKNQLKKLVEAKVNEAWYNNSDDFFKGLGKVTAGGILGTAALAGGTYCLDKGLEQQDRYEQRLNQEAQRNMYGSEHHYKEWCQENGLNPENQGTRDYYDSWVEDQLREDKLKYIIRRTIVENLVRKQLLKESGGLYTDDIDTYDLHVINTGYNDDGYCEWEATCSNRWYTFRGTFDGQELILDEIISGHSGHAREIDIDNEIMDWFEENLYDEIVDKIEEYDEQPYDEDEEGEEYELERI